MKLKKLTIQNFLSIKEANISLDNRGMVLITGINKDNPKCQSNGAGKSSITEGLTYVLYGKTLRGLRGDDVVHKQGKECKVSLEFSDEENNEYVITRYRKSKQYKNSVQLLMNGNDITPKSESDFTESIIELFQMDFITFTSAILYSAASFKFTSSTDAELKQAFDTMLGLEVYTSYHEKIKEKLKEVQNKEIQVSSVRENLNNSITQKMQQLDNLRGMEQAFAETKQTAVNIMSDEARNLQIGLNELQIEQGKLKEELEDTQSMLTPVEQKLATLTDNEALTKKWLQGISVASDKLHNIQVTENSLKFTLQSCKDSIQAIEQTEQRETENIKKLSAKKDKVLKDVGNPCPTCGQPLPEEALEKTIQEIDEGIQKHIQQLDSLGNTKDEKEKEAQELESELAKVSADVVATSSLKKQAEDGYLNVSKQSEEYTKLKSKAEKLRSNVLELKHNIDKIEIVYNTRVEHMKDKLKQLKNKMAEENPYIFQIQENEKEQIELHNNLMKSNIDKIQIEKEITMCNYWLQAFSNSGIKSIILDAVTPYLNKMTNKYLTRLSSEHFQVMFSTQSKMKSGEIRDKFSISVVNEDGGNSYDASSSGERKRIDLAVQLALQSLVSSRSNKQLNILILDEFLDSLDEVGIENTLELLTEVSKDKSSVFVISHTDALKTVFTDTITIVKENGESILHEV